MIRTELIASLITAGTLLTASATATFAQTAPSDIGRLADHDPGPALTASSPVGYYLWHNDDGYHLVSHGPGDQHHFVAVLRTGGTFTNVDPRSLEPGDTVQVLDNGHELRFDAHTFGGFDGVHFRIDGGEHLLVNLRLDSQEIDTGSIYLGSAETHPAADPFVLDR